jgi:hypothetical protein
MKRLKTFFKYRYLRRKIRLKNYLNPRNLTDTEKSIKNVLIKVVSNPENHILPSLNNIYIQTKNKEYTIVISKNIIKISNHQLFIESKIDEYFREELMDIMHHYIDKVKTKMDNEIFHNEVEGLNYILNQLNQIK